MPTPRPTFEPWQTHASPIAVAVLGLEDAVAVLGLEDAVAVLGLEDADAARNERIACKYSGRSWLETYR